MRKSELVELLRNEHGGIDTALTGLTDDELRAPVLDGGWSIKDAIAHIATWERRIMRAITDADRGEEIAWPEPGFQIHETGRLNERDVQANRDRPLDDVMAESRNTLEDYVRWIESFADVEIPSERPYTPGITLEMMIRGNGDEHVREHRRAIETYIAGRGA